MKTRLVRGLALACLFGLGLLPAHGAEPYPAKPIRIVVGFAAGGPTDVIARLLAQEMTQSMGQSVVVDNKTGANSMIATREVAHAEPDGYTLLFTSLSHNVNPLLLGAKAGYEPLGDFVPISNAAVLPLIVVTAHDAPEATLEALLKKARSQPGAVSFGSAGNGGSGHLAGALLANLAKAEMTNVPFRGNGPALTEVMSGRVSFMFYPVVGIADFVAQKRIKVLAVGTPTRLAQFPDAPTMAESGFPGFDETAPWVGMLAPAKTSPAIVQRVYEEMKKALAKPEVKERMRNLGAVIVANSPEDYLLYLKQDRERWERVIKSSGIKPE